MALRATDNARREARPATEEGMTDWTCLDCGGPTEPRHIDRPNDHTVHLRADDADRLRADLTTVHDLLLGALSAGRVVVPAPHKEDDEMPDNEIHAMEITPVPDEPFHALGSPCWCQPTIEDVPPRGRLVIHRRTLDSLRYEPDPPSDFGSQIFDVSNWPPR